MSRQAEKLRPVTPIAANPPPSRRFFHALLQSLLGSIALLLTGLPVWAADTAVSSTRVWPAPDYTRVTIESQQPIRHKLFNLENPDRLVLDLEDVAHIGGRESLAAAVLVVFALEDTLVGGAASVGGMVRVAALGFQHEREGALKVGSHSLGRRVRSLRRTSKRPNTPMTALPIAPPTPVE